MEYSPVACMRQSCRCCPSDSLGCLPCNFSLVRAMAMPSRVRMWMRPASNSAKVARILKNSFPSDRPGRRASGRGPVSRLAPEAGRRWRVHLGRTLAAGRVSARPACPLRARRRGPALPHGLSQPARRHRHPLECVHLGEAVRQRKHAGLTLEPERLAHISRLGWAHILLTGEYRWPSANSSLSVRFCPYLSRPDVLQASHGFSLLAIFQALDVPNVIRD